MARRQISVMFDSDAPRNQAWMVAVTDGMTDKVVSRHRLKKNAVQKAREIKERGDSGVIWNKKMTGSKPL